MNKKSEIKTQISLYLPDKSALSLTILALVLNATFTIVVLNKMAYGWEIMPFTLYSIFYTLMAFYLGSNMKVYKINSSIVFLVMSIINVLRVFMIPEIEKPALSIILLLLSGLIGIFGSIRSYQNSKKRMELVKATSEEDVL